MISLSRKWPSIYRTFLLAIVHNLTNSKNYKFYFSEFKNLRKGIHEMENSASDSINQQTENMVDYNCRMEKRDTSPGRPGKKKLEALLNTHLKIKMTDGRVLIGIFLCTDRDANVILGSCSEYLREEDCCVEEPRTLGLVMVPGRHIVTIQKDQC